MKSLYENPDKLQSEYNINANKTKSVLAINGEWSYIIEAISALTDENKMYKFNIERMDDSECLIHVRETTDNYEKKIPERLSRLYLKTEDLENNIEDLTIENKHTIYIEYTTSRPNLKFGPFESVNIRKSESTIIEELKMYQTSSTPLRDRLGIPRLNSLFQNGIIVCPDCGETSLYVNDINVENVKKYAIDCASDCGFSYEQSDISWSISKNNLRNILINPE